MHGEGLTFSAYQGLDGFERLASKWRVLAETIPNVRFNQLPEWYRAYLTSLEADCNRVWFVAAYRDGKLAAIFPLQFQNVRVGMLRLRILGLIEHDQMQLSDFVFAQRVENELVLDEFAEWLRNQRIFRWDELRLRRVPEGSSIAYVARTRLPRATTALRFYASAYFSTDGTYEQATQGMTAKFKSNLRRRNRIAETIAPLRHQSYSTPQELDEAFEIFLDIEASGWKGEAGTSSAIRCQAALLAFFSNLMRGFGARHGCVINLLWHGDQAVAGQFCLRVGKTLNILKVGFSEAHSQFAPGVLMLERVVRQACEDPEVDIVHLVNRPHWAAFFKPQIATVWCYFTPNWTVPGFLLHSALSIKHRWQARHVSASQEFSRQFETEH
jgi:CelD/BcsL family acetyltransferase involved in cellulose biosynthesis